MNEQGPVRVDFAAVKRLVSVPDVLREFGLLDRFTVKGNKVSGVCPLPSHVHNPVRPNPEQWKADSKRGHWLWKCFSAECNQGGDVISLVKQLAGLSDEHARLWFWEHFQTRLSAEKAKHSPGRKKTETKKACGDQVQVDHAQAVTEPTVTVSDDSAEGKCLILEPLRFHLNLDHDAEYLVKDRKMKPATVRRFAMGLCAKGILAGYIAIPIFRYPKGSPKENPIGYLGRLPSETFDDDHPRYKFPAEFPRNKVVYGLDLAMSDSLDGAPLVVVEGPLKVAWIYQETGIASVVATFGASLSDEQAELLVNTGRPIVLMYDGGSGRPAMRIAAGKFIKRAFVRVVDLPDGVEPDDLSGAELRDILKFY